MEENNSIYFHYHLSYFKYLEVLNRKWNLLYYNGKNCDMSGVFQLDDAGNCQSCKKLPNQCEYLQCRSCKLSFHILCQNNDKREATVTTVKAFQLPSTKGNFIFFCNKCLTEFEICQAQDDTKRLNPLES